MAVQSLGGDPGALDGTRDGGRRRFLLLIGALVALAWATLWLWDESPYGRYLDHGRWTEIGLAGSICRSLPGGAIILPGVLYVGGWVVMTTAMMLPTTVSLLDVFRRLTRQRRDGGRLVGLVVLGYLSVWSLFGVAAHALDWGVNEAVRQSVWLGLNGWVLGAAVLASAGVFQFSALKYRCLDKCRAPLSFVLRHWRGSRVRRQAFVIGAHHGIYCVGCCWALMLLMFVVGTGSVGWMLLLGAVMAVEKNLPAGRRLSKPLGGLLLAGSAVVAFQGSVSPV